MQTGQPIDTTANSGPNPGEVMRDYLTKVIDLYSTNLTGEVENPHIGFAFQSGKNKGRLFSTDLPISIEGINEIARKQVEEFDKRYATINPYDISSVQTDFVDYFFKPIEEITEWKNFWNEQRAAIEKDPTVTDKTQELQKIRNQIAAAYVYRIQSVWSIDERFKAHFNSNTAKASILMKVSNALGEGEDPDSLMNRLLQRERDNFKNAIERIESLVVSDFSLKKIKLADIPAKVMEKLNEIRQADYYQKIPNAEIQLQILLRQMFHTLVNLRLTDKNKTAAPFFKHQQEILNATAYALLHDIYDHHYSELQGKERVSDQYLANIAMLKPYTEEGKIMYLPKTSMTVFVKKEKAKPVKDEKIEALLKVYEEQKAIKTSPHQARKNENEDNQNNNNENQRTPKLTRANSSYDSVARKSGSLLTKQMSRTLSSSKLDNEGLFTEHLMEWKNDKRVTPDRWFVKNFPENPNLSAGLILQRKADAEKIFANFKDPEKLKNVLDEIFEKINTDLEKDDNWKKIQPVISKFTEDNWSEAEVKKDIFASYIFAVQTHVYTDVNGGFREKFQKLSDDEKQAFKGVLRVAKAEAEEFLKQKVTAKNVM